LIEIESKTADKNSAQTNRHYENNGHLAVNQQTALWPVYIPSLKPCKCYMQLGIETETAVGWRPAAGVYHTRVSL